MIPDECPHGMGDPAWCTMCNGRAGTEERALRAELRTVPFLWEARFPGVCAVCRDDIHLLEMIGRNVNGAYVCGGCAEVEP